jgi:translation initiation factor IF-1
MRVDRQFTAVRKIQLASLTCFQAVVLMLLTGCWTPPNANVQPKGEPRLIQSGVSVQDNNVRATVQTIDATSRTLTLKLSDGTPVTCTVSPQVKNLDQIQAGDQVKVTLAEKLAVYVLKDGRLPSASGTEEVTPFIARVQVVDPSYRLLTVQYLNGQIEVLKADLDAKLTELQPGDAVVLQSAEAVAIHMEKK